MERYLRKGRQVVEVGVIFFSDVYEFLPDARDDFSGAMWTVISFYFGTVR